MKKFIIPALLLAFTIGSCNKDESSPAPINNPGTNPSTGLDVGDVNNMKITMSKVNTPVAPHNPQNYSIWIEMHNGVIYTGNPSNTPIAQYFDKYDLTTNTFTALPVNDEVCACGYMSNLVSDRSGAIYYIANEAVKYSVSGSTWSNVTYPETAQDNNGETASIYFDNKIYYIGGRDISKTVRYFDLPTQSWYNAPDFPYATGQGDGVGVGNKMYVLGGKGNKNGFSVYDKTANNWTALPSLPFDGEFYYATHNITAIDKYIFVLRDKKIWVYDTGANQWATNPLPNGAEINNYYANLFSWDGKLYIAGKNNANDFQLYQATVGK